MLYKDTAVDELWFCRASIPKRGDKFKYESPSASKQAVRDSNKARMKEIWKKERDKKNRVRERLDKYHVKRKAYRAARRKATEAEQSLVSALKTTR